MDNSVSPKVDKLSVQTPDKRNDTADKVNRDILATTDAGNKYSDGHKTGNAEGGFNSDKIDVVLQIDAIFSLPKQIRDI